MVPLCSSVRDVRQRSQTDWSRRCRACASRLNASERRRVFAEHVLHRSAYLAQGRAVLERLADGRQQVALAASRVTQLLQPTLHELLVALRLELGQALKLFAL